MLRSVCLVLFSSDMVHFRAIVAIGNTNSGHTTTVSGWNGNRVAAGTVSEALHHWYDLSNCLVLLITVLTFAAVQIALWGNKCDLSISGGASNSQTDVDVLGQVDVLQPYVLCDETSNVWNLLSQKRRCCIDIVLDNAGFELFTDLCLAEFLISSGMASRVRFYGKLIPWFVSDVTATDWQWSLDQLATSATAKLQTLGQRWQQYLADGVWQFSTHPFWTLPYDFTAMKSAAPDLYDELSAADIVLFKGDLNYRKLVDDRVWPTTTPFTVALRGFSPSSLCCLRTLKCDVVVGLSEGQAESARVQHADWMITGSYAVIQFSNVTLWRSFSPHVLTLLGDLPLHKSFCCCLSPV